MKYTNKVRPKGKHQIRVLLIGFLIIIIIISCLILLISVSLSSTSNTRILLQDWNHVEITNLRYVTVILPSVVNPLGRIQRLQAIMKTWGPQARAIVVTEEDKEIPNDAHIQQYPPIIVPNDVAKPNEGVPRLRYAISQVHTLYDPDFAFFVNDHTFVIPNHISKFLDSPNGSLDPFQHLYAGHALKAKNSEYAFNSGASGYFLSRRTMKTLVQKWASPDGDPMCDVSNNFIQGNPGLSIAMCLHSIGIDPIDTRDEFLRHRFHAFGILRQVKLEVDEWYLKKHDDLSSILGMDERYHHTLQKGKECCSKDTISFHYVEWKETLALFDILEKLKKDPDISDGELINYIQVKWPSNKRDVGGYAHNLPPGNKKHVWDDFLKVLRNIS